MRAVGTILYQSGDLSRKGRSMSRMQRRLSWSCGFIVVLVGVISFMSLHKGSSVHGEIANEEELDPETRIRIINATKSLLGSSESKQHDGSDICSDLQWIEDVHDAVRWFLPGINGAAIQWAEAEIDPAAAKAQFSTVSLKAASTLMSMLTQREALYDTHQQARSCQYMDTSDKTEVLSRLIRVLFFTELLELHWSETQ